MTPRSETSRRGRTDPSSPRHSGRLHPPSPGCALGRIPSQACRPRGRCADRNELRTEPCLRCRRDRLVFAKKDGEAQRGRVIWREPLCWIACDGFNYDADDPCLWSFCRRHASTAPSRSTRSTRVAVPSGSPARLKALWVSRLPSNAVMGVTVLGRSFARSGLVSLSAPGYLPILPYTEITMLGEERVSTQIVHTLVEFLREAMQRNSAPPSRSKHDRGRRLRTAAAFGGGWRQANVKSCRPAAAAS